MCYVYYIRLFSHRITHFSNWMANCIRRISNQIITVAKCISLDGSRCIQLLYLVGRSPKSKRRFVRYDNQRDATTQLTWFGWMYKIGHFVRKYFDFSRWPMHQGLSATNVFCVELPMKIIVCLIWAEIQHILMKSFKTINVPGFLEFRQNSNSNSKFKFKIHCYKTIRIFMCICL